MKALLAFFVNRHLLVNMIVVCVLGVGGFVVKSAQREGFPATDLALARVIVLWPGASAQDVESQITIPIERALKSVDSVRHVTSTSSQSVAFLLVELFDDLSADELEDAVADLQAELDGVKGLPSDLDAPPRVRLLNPARIPAMEVFLTGPRQVTQTKARELKPILERVEGVSEVIPVALGDREIRVLVDPSRLLAHDLTLDDVIGAIASRNRTDTGGKLDAAERRQLVVQGAFRSADELLPTVVRAGPQGTEVRLDDVARVEVGTEERGVRARGDGDDGVALIVRKRASADIMRVVDRLRDTLDTFDAGDGVDVRVYRDSSEIARQRLQIVATNGVGGIILVLLVLVIFLNRRIALWVAFGIPFAVLGTAMLLPQLGITINVVSTAAFVLVIGLIVDDAIVVAERIAFHRERGLRPSDAGVLGTYEMARPVIAASLTTVMAFSPMFAVGGLPGRFAWAIPTIVIVALSVSLFECFFLLPAHLSGDEAAVGDTKPHDEKAAWMVKLEARYSVLLRRLLRRRVAMVAGFVLFFVGTMSFAAAFMPIILFPQDDARVLLVKLQMPLGTPLERTEGAVALLEERVKALMGDDVDSLNTRVGHRQPQSSKDLGDAENEAIISVFLKKGFKTNALLWSRALKKALPPPPGGRLWFEHRQIGPPVGKPVTLHVACDDDALRSGAVRFIKGALGGMPAVTDIDDDNVPGLRQIDLAPDHAEMLRLQVPIDTVFRSLRAAFLGLPISEIRRTDEVMRIRVRFDQGARQDLDALLDTRVRSRLGALVPLRSILRPRETPSVAHLHHRDGVRTTTVTAFIDPTSGETATSIAKRLRTEVLPQPQLQQAGLEVSIGGEAEKSAETIGELPTVALMALIGMLMIVTLLFGSALQAFFIVIAVPLGYAGVVWTFAAHGLQLSFFALLGAIGLSGVVVNDSIVMVSTLTAHLDRLRARGTGGPHEPTHEEGLDAVVSGAAERLRPVLLTTLTTVVGVMPTAYGLGGRDALLSPMSLALGWGLVFATLITLFLVPALFVVRQDLTGRRRRSATDQQMADQGSGP